MTQTELINAIIKGNAPLPIEEIVKLELTAWRSSPKRTAMLDGQRYYEAGNDILTRKRMAIGKNGQLTKVKNVANNRIAHAFLQELVDQKTQYLLGKPFSIQSDDDAFVQAIYEVFGDDEALRHLLKRTAKDAINKGISWLHVYYDTEGSFKLKRMEPEEMIPLWADNEHTVLNGMIRVYPVELWEASIRKIIHKVELWTDDGVQRWVERDGGLTADADLPSGPHMTDAEGKPFNWQRLPFVALKYNDEERPLLHKVKTLVDEYDRTVSDDANMLEDQPNKVFVIKNFDGSDLGEFRRNMSIYRAVKVLSDGPGGGGVDTLDTTPDVTASNQHLERIRRDIPPFHPRCRCTTVAVFDDLVTEGSVRAAKEGKGGYRLVPADMTFEEWRDLFVDKSPFGDKIKLSDIEIPRNLGAAAFRDTVKLPSGKLSKITEGTKITKVVVFAGKGTKRPVEVAKYLSRQYGVPESEWRKVRGDGYVDDGDESRHAELHWFEADGVGRVQMKVKRWFDES